MIEWWNNLELSQQIFALIAMPSTLILIIQTVLMIIGIGAEGADVDSDGIDSVDGDVEVDGGVVLFSVRGILSMLTIMGWVGVALLGTAMPDWAAILIAIACGILTLVGIAYLMRAMVRLQSSGNIDIGNCIGKVAQVYIPIPASSAGTGKVNITVQSSYQEFSAITTHGEPLKTGSFVRVVAVGEGGILVVEPIAAPEK